MINRKIITRFLCSFLIGSLILSMCACGVNEPPPLSAEVILSEMLAATTPVEGDIRTLTAENEKQQISKELLSALYGSIAVKWIDTQGSTVVDDAAFYLSKVMHPYEVAVFRCVSEGDTTGGLTSVMGVCASRLDMIRNVWKGSEYEIVTQNAVVTCCGAYVLLIVAEDPEPLTKAAERIIKRQ